MKIQLVEQLGKWYAIIGANLFLFYHITYTKLCYISFLFLFLLILSAQALSCGAGPFALIPPFASASLMYLRYGKQQKGDGSFVTEV